MLTLVAQVVLLYCKGTSGNFFMLCVVPLWLAHDNPGSVLQQTGIAGDRCRENGFGWAAEYQKRRSDVTSCSLTFVW